jgi:hypothetical protein
MSAVIQTPLIKIVQTNGIRSDTKEAIRFLSVLRPLGPWVLCSKCPDRGPFETKTFTILADAEAWIEQRNGNANIFITINPIIHPVTSKPKKADILGGEYLHVDLDPAGEDIDRERERILNALRNFNPLPTIIIDSGSGYWGLWRLDQIFLTNGDAQKIAQFEAYSRGIELALDGDGCSNIDRLMRLVGTVNLPDEKKRKKGRKRALAKMVWVMP